MYYPNEKKLEDLSIPIQNWLLENYDLHTMIIISPEGVKVVQDKMYIPLEIED